MAISASESAGVAKPGGTTDKREGRKWLVLVTAIAVAEAVVIATLFVYYSPDYSWGASIRDRDGDGVPDSKDALPDNRLVWGRASATVVVTIVNNYGIDLNYTLYCLGADIPGTIANGSSVNETLLGSWDIGVYYSGTGVALVQAYYYDNGLYTVAATPEEHFGLIPDQTLSVTVTIEK